MGSIFEFDEFEFDVENQQLRRAGVATKTDGLLLRLLDVFVRSPGQLITKEELVARVWGGRAVSENALTVAMTRLRKALQHERGAREIVLTVHGHGYRFVPAVVERDGVARGAAVASSPAGVVAPFVGRERVISQLTSAMLETRGGRGSAIVLTGEPGIGKTKVAEMLARSAPAAKVAVAWAYCRGLDDMAPLWPFVELLREVIAGLPREAIADDPRFLALRPELGRLLPELASSSVQPERRDTAEPWIKLAPQHRIFDAVRGALALASEHTPQVLILDDLGRADAATVELLRYLLPELPRMRILLICTLRSDPESAANPQLARVINHRNCTSLALPPLRETDVASYVVALLGNVDGALCRLVFEKSEGSPLFMTELVRQLRASEQPDASALTTPSVALEVLRQRVAGLDDAALDVLTCGAVVGRSFGLALLQAITGRRATDLMTSLDSAIAREVVMPVRDSSTEFLFAHELLRAALYETLAASERRAWHLRVAQALEPRVALGEVPIAELASHALAALPDGDLRKTVDYCMQASSSAERVYAYADAARYLQHARRALDLIEGASPRLRFGLIFRQALYARGFSTREFQPLVEQLLTMGRELGNPVALAHAATLLDPFPGFPPLPGSRAALADALASLPEDAQYLRAAMRIRLATSAPWTRDAAESDVQLERSLELASRSPDVGDRLTALFAELYLYGGPAHEPRAAEALRELQDICNQHVATFTLPPVLLDVHRALTAAQQGDMGTMTRALERSEARCREFGIDLLWHIERFRALSRINAGHTAEGQAALRKLHQRAMCVGPIAGAELFCAYDASVVLRVGVPSSAQRTLEPNAEDAANVWALKVRALAAGGCTGEARAALMAVPADVLTRLRPDREYLGTLGALARAALAVQAADHARILYQLLLPYPEHFAVNLAFLCEGSASLLLGVLARSFGQPAKAREHLELAIAVSEQAGFLASAAEARLELKRC